MKNQTLHTNIKPQNTSIPDLGELCFLTRLAIKDCSNILKPKPRNKPKFPTLQPNRAPPHSNLTTDTSPPQVQRRTKEMHTFSNLKNPILPLSPPTSPYPFSSFHSSTLSLASSALSLTFMLSGDPNLCPFFDVADPKTLSELSTGKVTMVGAWWSGLSYLGSLVFTPGLDPLIVAWL